jgi:hypothetical protein
MKESWRRVTVATVWTHPRSYPAGDLRGCAQALRSLSGKGVDSTYTLPTARVSALMRAVLWRTLIERPAPAGGVGCDVVLPGSSGLLPPLDEVWLYLGAVGSDPNRSPDMVLRVA